MFFEEDDPNNAFILILTLFSWINALQELSCLTTILPHEPRSIPNKKFPTFIPKLTRSDISIIAILIQFSKNLLQASSYMIIYSHIIRCEDEDIVAE